MIYQTEDEILRIVRAFENGTISRSEWRHAEHLTVAFYYVFITILKRLTSKCATEFSIS